MASSESNIISKYDKNIRRQIRIDIMRNSYCFNVITASTMITYMLIKKPFRRMPWPGMILPAFLTSITYSSIIFGSVFSMKYTRKLIRTYILPIYYDTNNYTEKLNTLKEYNIELDKLA